MIKRLLPLLIATVFLSSCGEERKDLVKENTSTNQQDMTKEINSIQESTPTVVYSPFGNVYVQFSVTPDGQKFMARVGDASYHFVEDDNIYINWEHTDENGWVFEDGDSLPKKLMFTETSYNTDTKTFKGKLKLLKPLAGEGFNKATILLDYTRFFSPKCLRIIGGHINSYNEDNEFISKMEFDINNWSYEKKD